MDQRALTVRERLRDTLRHPCHTPGASREAGLTRNGGCGWSQAVRVAETLELELEALERTHHHICEVRALTNLGDP
jgi:hypothetical protein